jgi:hypothetical protein
VVRVRANPDHGIALMHIEQITRMYNSLESRL